MAKTLSAGDFYPDEPIAAFAWPMLVQAGGLAEITGGKLQLTAKGRAALGKPAAGVVQALWRSWLTKGLIDEFSRVENIKGQRAANVLTAPKARRQKVSEALAAQPAGEWVDVDDLFGQMKQTARSPRVARSERALWKLYLEDPHYGSLGYAGFGDWELLEGRYTLAVLFEYAATLGLIDVAYDEPGGARDDYHENWGADYIGALSRYDGLRAVRLNDLGAYVLGLSMSYTPPEPEAPGRTVKVLPNLDVVAVGRLAPAELLVLESYARRAAARRVRRVSAGPGRAARTARHAPDTPGRDRRTGRTAHRPGTGTPHRVRGPGAGHADQPRPEAAATVHPAWRPAPGRTRRPGTGLPAGADHPRLCRAERRVTTAQIASLERGG